MNLKSLISNIEVLEIKGCIDGIDISSLEYDSREVKNGSLFFARKGLVVDGHKFIPSAIKNGAATIVCEYLTDTNIPQIKVEDIRKSMADLACAFYNNPSKELNLIGITATNGKTTTAFMTKYVLEEGRYNVGISGTVEIKYNDVLIPSLLTTPESIVLQKHFRNMVDGGVDRCVMEVSSNAQEAERVRGVEYDIVTFNNFAKEHVAQHGGSLERYYNSKSRLITEAKPSAIAILNMDFKEIAVLKDKTAAKTITYSLENEDQMVYIKNVDLTTGFGEYDLYIKEDIDLGDLIIEKQNFHVSCSIPGYSSVMNSIVAILIGLINKIPVDVILRGLKKFKGVERRFEEIYSEDFRIIDDHFANVDNIRITLETLSRMEYKNLHILHYIRGSRGADLNGENAEEFAKWYNKLRCKKIILTKSIDIVSEKDKVLDEEVEAFREVFNRNSIDFELRDTLRESIYEILSGVSKGDVVLFAGSQGMDKALGIAAEYLLSNNIAKDRKFLINKVENRIC